MSATAISDGRRVKLTDHQRALLVVGARHPNGVVAPMIHAGFAGVVTRKNVAKLEALGLIVSNAHGDHYITDEGRALLTALTQEHSDHVHP